jgi:hypothetical protein
MKKLYLVPIIHTGADMGSLALVMEKETIAGLGEELWQRHQEIVSHFWDSIAQFFASLNDARGFKIYQDGLVTNGVEGLKIIKDGIRKGSKNYEIIGKLLERGAILIRTEDFTLVKKEYNYIEKIVQSKSPREKEAATYRYKLAQAKLIKQRDDFIVKRIKETLGEGETGILFIGAYHDILPKLPYDIKVSQIKDIAKVREYQTLLTSTRGSTRHFHQLAEYLAVSEFQ